jgi:hypothetical protein
LVQVTKIGPFEQVKVVGSGLVADLFKKVQKPASYLSPFEFLMDPCKATTCHSGSEIGLIEQLV